MKAVLFDLDNTLYPEIDFVKSGLKAVTSYLCSRYKLNEELLYTQIYDILQRNGRGKVFDVLLRDLGLHSEENICLLVYLYRSHSPIINLYDDVFQTVRKLRSHGMKLGIITDGMASVQKNKIVALSLENLFDVIICTDELGKDYWKPSVVPYKIALDLLEVSFEESAYIGDDLSKDFIGPNSLGMLTIQMKRDELKFLSNTDTKIVEARYIVKELKEILPILGIHD